MNKYQTEGSHQTFAGKIQEELGKIMGNKSQQAYDRHPQLSGKSAKLFGDARELIRQSIKNR